jgi:hypothetical protein
MKTERQVIWLIVNNALGRGMGWSCCRGGKRPPEGAVCIPGATQLQQGTGGGERASTLCKSGVRALRCTRSKLKTKLNSMA